MKQIISIDNINANFDFDIEKLSKTVIKEVLKIEKIKYDISINILLVTNSKIKKINKTERNIDKNTDVLSFPNVAFKKPSDFKPYINKTVIDVSIVDLVTKTIFLGDIIINKSMVIKQAKLYGHSLRREYSFLLVHSILHLLGYDHLRKRDEMIMFKKQDEILNNLKIYK